MKSIIELAKQAGMVWQGGFTRVVECVTQTELERFAALVRAAALEEAAETVLEFDACNPGYQAAAIRALKEKT